VLELEGGSVCWAPVARELLQSSTCYNSPRSVLLADETPSAMEPGLEATGREGAEATGRETAGASSHAVTGAEVEGRERKRAS